MHLTQIEFWTAVHGMVFGALFISLFSGAFIAICGLRVDGRDNAERGSVCLRSAGRAGRWASVLTFGMASVAWITVILGTYQIYPNYRRKPPLEMAAHSAMLAQYPRSFLLSNPRTAGWHNFGMEWKEHVAWLVPILATAVAFVVCKYGRAVARDVKLRRATLMLLCASFACAAVAGVLGAFIDKAAPLR